MSKVSLQELYKLLREGQDKYIYFLLAGAGASIAFAISQTKDASLSVLHVPLGAAVLAWAVSFYCGCKQLRQHMSIVTANYQVVRVQQGANPQFPPDPRFVELITADLEKDVQASGRWGIWQFRFLVGGAVLYIAWHILEMYVRSTHAT